MIVVKNTISGGRVVAVEERKHELIVVSCWSISGKSDTLENPIIVFTSSNSTIFRD